MYNHFVEIAGKQPKFQSQVCCVKCSLFLLNCRQ